MEGVDCDEQQLEHEEHRADLRRLRTRDCGKEGDSVGEGGGLYIWENV